MKSKLFISALAVLILMTSTAFSQENEDLGVEKRPGNKLYNLFVNISSTGTGIGLRFHYPTDNPDLKYSIGFQIAGVKGKNDFAYIDPYTYNYIRHREFWTMMAPVTFGVKRRLWRESIEPDFRPYVRAEIGPVFGVAFPTGDGFSEGIKRGKGQVTAGAYFGFGVDFGDQTNRVFGVSLGMHYIPFPETLGERKAYTGIDLRLNILNYF